MCACSHHKTPLQRSGTNQQQRLLPGLNAAYVQVDERTEADRIVFAGELAAWLKYYSLSNTATTNWMPFFRNDVSAVLAQITVQDTDQYRRSIKSRFSILQSDEHQADTLLLQETLGALFGALFTLSAAWDQIMTRLPEEIALKQSIRNIKIKLSGPLERLLSYYKAALDLNLIAEKEEPDWKIMGQPFTVPSLIIQLGLQQEWWAKPATDWNDYYQNKITADESVFGTDPAWDTYRRIHQAANHNLFKAIFDQYLMSFAQIVKEASSALQATMDNWDTHQAHYTLFLAFLKLFRFPQEHINTLTQQHLDFYYKEVLKLLPKKAVPNQAHILVELAKPVNSHLLPKGTLFKAGKDSAGTDVAYTLDRDVVFNKAQVAGLLSVYKGTTADQIGTVNNQGRLFAAPVINSADGLGAELTSPYKEWHPFVNKQRDDAGALTAINIPKAAIGFAIASHYLYLTEGQREVKVKLVTSNNGLLAAIRTDCYLTTEKEWLKVDGVAVTTTTTSDGTACVQLAFTLNGDVPPIVNYDPAVHGGVFSRRIPTLKVYLNNDDAQEYQYDDLQSINLSRAEIEVNVGETGAAYSDDGLKQLQLSGDFGVIDASKPFQPFGAVPAKDASFIIGNKEVFSKKNAKIKLNINWANLPASAGNIDLDTEWPNYPSVKLSLLEGGIWQEKVATTDIFNLVAPKVAVFGAYQPISNAATVSYANTYDVYNTASNAGFARLTLNGHFGHKDYPHVLAVYFIEKANKTDPPTYSSVPVEPYTPLVQSLHLSYTALTKVNFTTDANAFNARDIHFFSLYPFGILEQEQIVPAGQTLPLLPQFLDETDGDPLAAEFYIGLKSLQPLQTVNILFQLLEGTADPQELKPEEHVRWSYLSNNTWKPFDELAVRDATRQLIQSGIISFDIPSDAALVHSLLPTDHIWIRASVKEAVAAVCKILTVAAQAALVIFKDQQNAPDFLNTALPAGAISKLQEPDTAVKKILQPYNSVGGQPQENSDHFYIRVSERLRHKSRAITIWDYERLVLEAFPQIHKVKCLSHTKITQTDYNEVAPGFVSVITIPDLMNRNDANPLRPFTNKNVLKEIEDFLRKKVPCHVQVAAHDPQFEEVRMELHLKVFPRLDTIAMVARLQEEITGFLTPWAYNNSTDIQFGGKIYKSSLINFIEERPYVDYITDVKMFHKPGDKAVESGDLEEATAATARSILVSAPAAKHVIHIIEEISVEEKENCYQK